MRPYEFLSLLLSVYIPLQVVIGPHAYLWVLMDSYASLWVFIGP